MEVWEEGLHVRIIENFIHTLHLLDRIPRWEGESSFSPCQNFAHILKPRRQHRWVSRILNHTPIIPRVPFFFSQLGFVTYHTLISFFCSLASFREGREGRRGVGRALRSENM